MQVSIKWLKDYIDFEETPLEIADKLTMAGIPVENVVDPGEGLEKVITGRIEKLEKHRPPTLFNAISSIFSQCLTIELCFFFCCIVLSKNNNNNDCLLVT